MLDKVDGPRNALVKRATIEEIARNRQRAFELYSEAVELDRQAEVKRQEAHASRKLAAPSTEPYMWRSDDEETSRQYTKMELYQRETDRAIWTHILRTSNLETLMDKTARDEFHQSLEDDPPPATADNIFATTQQLMISADDIFKRGIAVAFANLDRRFRSHDGFKIGSRIILNHCFDDFGSWNHYRKYDATLSDIERVFTVLNGDQFHGSHLVVSLRDAIGYNNRTGEVETQFFKAVVYKNGNLHLWFKRDDLVTRVNQLIGEFYGELIPDASAARPGKWSPPPAPKQAPNMGFFETPDGVLTQIEDAIGYTKPEMRVLEPSAGLGAIAMRFANKGLCVDCYELHPERAAVLSTLTLNGAVWHEDFLEADPSPIYDLIVMNPPFAHQADIAHVRHALKFLKPGTGVLVAIMSAGVAYREDRNTTEFRKEIEKLGGMIRDLPMESFKESGTMVNTCILKVRFDGRTWW